MAIKVKVTQVKSAIGRPETQRLTLKGLGLNGPNQTKVLLDTPALRGMLRKVSHLISISSAD